MHEVTRLLDALGRGERRAAEELLPLVYEELRRLAAQKLGQEKPGHTLQPTALVHEAYVRLVGAELSAAGAPRWDGRGHFFAAAAEAMRRILVENARRKRRLKRGGDRQRVDLAQAAPEVSSPPDDLLAVDEALDRLAEEDPQKAELVKLRFFAGLSVEEAAACLDISRATADRWWAYARAWLFDRLENYL
ncbi:MAG: ECF-type sigma factor [Gemmataceae bacterium]|nr:ECF-type sigma factor [Gemmataceae bacterium]